MALTTENLNTYFEKSERLNMLQGRIKSYITLLEERYGKVAFEKVRDIPISERQRKAFGSRRAEFLEILDAKLEVSWYIDTDQPGVCPRIRFFLFSGDKGYELSVDFLPSKFVEPVYNHLARLTAMLGLADKGIYAQIEREVLDFIQ